MADFANTYTVTPSAGSGGTISPNTTQPVNYNSTISFTITPDNGYSANVSGTCGGSPSSGSAQFTYTTNSIMSDCTVSATFSAYPPVRIARATPVYYSTLQAAYNAAVSGDIIQSQAITFTENLSVNREISLTLQGGYDNGYATNSGNVTNLKGMIQTSAGGGTLTISNFNIVQ